MQRKKTPASVIFSLTALLTLAGCASNPLPEEFVVQRSSVTGAEARACQAMAGHYEYFGQLVEGDLKYLAPNAGDLLLLNHLRQDWRPVTLEISTVRADANQFMVTFLAMSDDIGMNVISASSAEGWCLGGRIRLIEERAGGGEGSYVASWLVRELTQDSSGHLQVMYAYSSRKLLSGTDAIRALVRFAPKGSP